jgi:hypothetical protein
MTAYGIIWITLIALNDMPDKVYGFTWLDELRHLIVRLGHLSLVQCSRDGRGGQDNTIFLLVLAAGFWLVTHVAVWNTIRQQHLWRAVAPAGVAS